MVSPVSSPLIFVRDGRTLPFIPITTVALQRIRDRCQKRPYATATYVALLELANEGRADRAAVTQKLISERVGSGRTTVQAAIDELRDAGLVVVIERVHANQRLENEYVLVEPDQAAGDDDESGTPARVAGDPRPPGEQRTQERREESSGQEDVRASTDAFPDDLPASMHETAISAGKILKATALAREQRKAVTRAAVGHAVLSFPDRDHVQVARELEAWMLHGRGASQSCADVVARYRNFLKRAEPMAGPPLRGARPAGPRPGSAAAGADFATRRRLDVIHGGG